MTIDEVGALKSCNLLYSKFSGILFTIDFYKNIILLVVNSQLNQSRLRAIDTIMCGFW